MSRAMETCTFDGLFHPVCVREALFDRTTKIKATEEEEGRSGVEDVPLMPLARARG